MTTKKRQSRKRKSRSKRVQKRHKFFTGGSCSMCASCMSQSNSMSQPAIGSFFSGGKKCTCKRTGGGNDPPSFTGTLPQRYYAGLNTYAQDPNDPSAQIAARQLPNISGGKSRTKKAHKRGGNSLLSWFNGQMGTPNAFNPVNTMGEIATSQLGSNYISGDITSRILQNPYVLSQPVDSKYNIHNMPMA